MSYFFRPEDNTLNPRKVKKAYPEAREPIAFDLSRPDVRIRKHLYDTQDSLAQDSLVSRGNVGTTQGGATFYLTSKTFDDYDIMPLRETNYKA